MSGPLKGLRVVEFAGLAPGPFCGKILADWGASVVRVDRPNAPDLDRLSAGKRSIVVNSKRPAGVKVLHKLCDASDVLIDPFRPGVLERLGLGPKVLHSSNPGLIYTRITGYGQTGPYSAVAGHDINYVALSGVLSVLGRKEGPPTPPINLLADFAGGGLMAAYGVAMALLHRTSTGKGQVVDCSMTEGVAYLSSFLYSTRDMQPIFGRDRGNNWLDSGSHFYDTYETSDGRHFAVGAVEPQFYAKFVAALGLDGMELEQYDNWEENKEIVRKQFKTKSFDHWCKVFSGTDACATPVLTMDEAPQFPHNKERGSFAPGSVPRPAPLLSHSPATNSDPAPRPLMGEHTEAVLRELGYSPPQVGELLEEGVVLQEELKAKL